MSAPGGEPKPIQGGRGFHRSLREAQKDTIEAAKYWQVRVRVRVRGRVRVRVS